MTQAFQFLQNCLSIIRTVIAFDTQNVMICRPYLTSQYKFNTNLCMKVWKFPMQHTAHSHSHKQNTQAIPTPIKYSTPTQILAWHNLLLAYTNKQSSNGIPVKVWRSIHKKSWKYMRKINQICHTLLPVSIHNIYVHVS